MTTEELATWAADFAAFHARLADLFARAEPREQVAKHLRGLLSGGERKNGWRLAELMGDASPDRMQRLLYQADWDADAARDRLQRFVIEHFGDPEAIGVVDETGFLKKGRHSVGVQRQYSGTAGRVENSQVATFLSYASLRGHAFLDRRLFLPEQWADDPARRERAKVPAAVAHQTKPQQAAAMLAHAWAQGAPMRWVAGDEVYGDAPALRATIRAHGRWYVLAVAKTTPVWIARPAVLPPKLATGGRPQTRPRLAPGAPPAQPVAAVVAAWPAAQWQRLTVAEGEKGPRTYDWAGARVVECEEQLPGVDAWLLARRSISDPSDLAYYLSYAPADTPLLTLARVAATRYTVEQCIEEAKGEAGLDEYEVRSWPSWHRHITLAMLAHAWLAAIRCRREPQRGIRNQPWPA
jgi:SRSO17 transposase